MLAILNMILIGDGSSNILNKDSLLDFNKEYGFNKQGEKFPTTAIANIKMPNDLFIGKSSVQTYIYVFRVGEKHEKDEIVKFINFSNDRYLKNARKKSNSNLIDIDNAKARYQKLVDLIRFGKTKLVIFSANKYYKSTINPVN